MGWLHGDEVAIKKLHIDGAHISEETASEFQKEVANLQGLRNPRLVSFIGVAFEPPTLCIITELASGGSLYALLHVQKLILSPTLRRNLALQVTEGVMYLHGLKPARVHRDLKSANVVLDGDMNAKLCDFGLTESMEKTHLSRRDVEGGSPRYMSPEVFDVGRKLTEKLDVWALGCLIIEILTDTLPHSDCQTIHQVAAKLLVNRHPPFNESWADGLNREVQQLIDPCFAFEPSDRPSASGLHQVLSTIDIFDWSLCGSSRII